MRRDDELVERDAVPLYYATHIAGSNVLSKRFKACYMMQMERLEKFFFRKIDVVLIDKTEKKSLDEAFNRQSVRWTQSSVFMDAFLAAY